jgi:hypothetical protein
VKKPMQITEEGRQLVASKEFQRHMREFATELHADGLSHDMGTAVLVTKIAWTLTGHDPYGEMTGDLDELAALKLFVDGHVAEINAIGDTCLTTAMEDDAELLPGGTTQA